MYETLSASKFKTVIFEKTSSVIFKNKLLVMIIMALPLQMFAQVPSLGSYANTTIVTSGDTMIHPSVAPSNANKIIVGTTANFSGILTVNPATGVVNVTNAKNAGTYIVTVKAIKGTDTTQAHFTLTVTNPLTCNQIGFSSPKSIGFGSSSSIEVGDFNNDGIQDFVESGYFFSKNGNEYWFYVNLGNGNGGFTTVYEDFIGGGDVTVNDFNGDGNQDIAIISYDNILVKCWIYLGNGTGAMTYVTDFSITNSKIITADFNNDGIQDIALSKVGAVSIYKGIGNGTFASPTDITVSGSPNSLVIGDFNNDNKLDLAISIFNSKIVSIQLGDGSGNFNDSTNVILQTGIVNLIVGDVNNDGNQDIVGTNRDSKVLSILLGNGNGAFTVSNLGLAISPTALEIGDLNGDGKLDFIVTGVDLKYNTIYLGNGLGGFTNALNIPLSTRITNLYKVVIGDFNRDGAQDYMLGGYDDANFLVLGGENLTKLSIIGNNNVIPNGDSIPALNDNTDFGSSCKTGNSTPIIKTFSLSNESNTPINLTPTSFSVTGKDSANFSITGIAQNVTINPNSSTTFSITLTPISGGIKNASIHVFYNASNCTNQLKEYTFEIKANIISPIPILGSYSNTAVQTGRNFTIIPKAVPKGITSISAESFQSFSGLLTADLATGSISITNARLAGTYPVIVTGYKNSCSTKDTFLLTINNPNCSQGIFSSKPNISVDGFPNTIAVGDFNRDGKQDIVTTNYNGATVSFLSVRLGDGKGGFTGNTKLPINNFSIITHTSIVVSDVNSDGMLDIVVSGFNLSTFLGDGAGGFTLFFDYNLGGTNSIAICDFNGDGKQDVIYGKNFDLTVLFGDGNGHFTFTIGHFTFESASSLTTNFNSIAIGDFNSDGKPDVATVKAATNVAIVYFGNGNGSILSRTQVNVGINPIAIASADFNNDGKLDFATANKGDSSITLCLGDGLGGFSNNITTLNVGTALSAMSVGDFNGNGKLDIITLSEGANNANNVSINLGDGTGFFSNTLKSSIGKDLVSLAVGDFNGDGYQDFATANNGFISVSILMGGAPFMTLKGNSLLIADGDNTPTVSDNTDFGTKCMNGSAVIKTFSIKNEGSFSKYIKAGSITISGKDSALFSISGISLPDSIMAGASKNFKVTFNPTLSTSGGIKNAVIHFSYKTNCGIVDYDFAVKAKVNTLPNATIFPIGPIAVCNGDSIKLNANTNTHFVYQWTILPTTIPGAVRSFYFAKAAGSYQVKITDTTTGCSKSSLVTKLTVNNLPVVANITGTKSVCVGKTTKLSNATIGGSWSSSNSSIATISSGGGLVSGKANGSVTINYTTAPNTNGCKNKTTAVVTVNPPCLLRPEENEIVNQLKEISSSFEPSIFPNPSNKAFSLRITASNQGNVEIRVIDVNGKIVYFTMGSPKQIYRFGEQFAEGFYIVNIIQGKEIRSIKIIKQK